jgi:CheY-like chemotaxis protein
MKRALIIDDDMLYRQAIRIVLENTGYEVVEAEDGAAGLEAARSESFDIIFCDMRMQKMRGDIVISTLKSDPKTRGVPVVLMTGNMAAAREDAGVRADFYLAKPFTIEAVLAIL